MAGLLPWSSGESDDPRGELTADRQREELGVDLGIDGLRGETCDGGSLGHELALEGAFKDVTLRARLVA
jgi:hypothetical protein